MGAALRHPFGLFILTATLALVGVIRFAPGLAPLSALEPWVLVWGLLTYVIAVVAVRFSRPALNAPELSKLRAIRRQMQATLNERKSAEGSGPSEITRILSEAIVELDTQVEPDLRQLIVRQQALSGYLAGVEKGYIPSPNENVLERLHSIHTRQRSTIDECVQNAANAAGTLVAIHQVRDDATRTEQIRTWADDLSAVYDAVAHAVHGVPEDEEAVSGIDPSSPEGEAVINLYIPNIPASGSAPDGDSKDLVEDALQHLNQPAVLSRCKLIDRLPNTLAAARASWDGGLSTGASSLRQSRALREVLIAAIDGLRPGAEAIRPGSPETLQYSILHEEYVREMSTASIRVRHSISESTFHRHRRQAIAAIATELTRNEELLGREMLRRQPDA